MMNASLPRRLRGRPQQGKLPIPFTSLMNTEGVADFRVNDPQRVNECARHNLCALCGHPLGADIVFVAGPGALEQRLFPDPPAHEACLRYAVAVCPFLIGKRARRPVEMDGLASMENMSAVRPDLMYLAWTRRVGMVYRRETGVLYFSAAPWSRVEEVA